VIYLDHNATTPMLPEVLDAMMPYLTTEWGNPSGSYRFGATLKSVIAAAREQVAELMGASALKEDQGAVSRRSAVTGNSITSLRSRRVEKNMTSRFSTSRVAGFRRATTSWPNSSDCWPG